MHQPIELQHVAEDIIYTDRSRREIAEAGIVTGAGVYRKSEAAPMSQDSLK